MTHLLYIVYSDNNKRSTLYFQENHYISFLVTGDVLDVYVSTRLEYGIDRIGSANLEGVLVQ